MSPLYALSALSLDFTRIITFSIFFKICSFIILIFKWFVIVERRFLPAPLARMCIFAPRFIFIVLTTWLTPYSYLGAASRQFLSPQTITLPVPTDNTFRVALSYRIYLTRDIATLPTVGDFQPLELSHN